MRSIKASLAAVALLLAMFIGSSSARAASVGSYALSFTYCGNGQAMAYYTNEQDTLVAYTQAVRRMADGSSGYKSIGFMVYNYDNAYHSISRINIDPSDYCPGGAVSPLLYTLGQGNEAFSFWNDPGQIAIATTYCGSSGTNGSTAVYDPPDRATATEVWARAVQRQWLGNPSKVEHMTWYDAGSTVTSYSKCYLTTVTA